jgi:hypothetical protein
VRFVWAESMNLEKQHIEAGPEDEPEKKTEHEEKFHLRFYEIQFLNLAMSPPMIPFNVT